MGKRIVTTSVEMGGNGSVVDNIDTEREFDYLDQRYPGVFEAQRVAGNQDKIFGFVYNIKDDFDLDIDQSRLPESFKSEKTLSSEITLQKGNRLLLSHFYTQYSGKPSDLKTRLEILADAEKSFIELNKKLLNPPEYIYGETNEELGVLLIKKLGFLPVIGPQGEKGVIAKWSEVIERMHSIRLTSEKIRNRII